MKKLGIRNYELGIEEKTNRGKKPVPLFIKEGLGEFKNVRMFSFCVSLGWTGFATPSVSSCKKRKGIKHVDGSENVGLYQVANPVRQGNAEWKRSPVSGLQSIVFFVALFFLMNTTLFAVQQESKQKLSADSILEKVDKNFVTESRISESKLIIRGRRGIRTITAKTYAEGIDKTFTVYLDPPREKNTKMLKLEDELWIWTPSSDRIIKIAGHMLRQSMSGSDISYEDFMEDPVLKNNYDAKVTGEELVDERLCYVLELYAKIDKTANVSYHKRKIWVDKKRFVPLKENLFAKSGKLLKTFTITDVFFQDGRWYPRKMTFKDVLKRGKGTDIVIEKIEFDVKIPQHIFSKASLRK